MMKNNQFTKNLLIRGDNLKVLDDLKEQGIKVDLIYLDPPFFSNKHYEVIWGDEAEVRSFKDRWAGGINVYIEWMRERIVKMYDILMDTGSFYLHCDWHAGHYLKVMLDEIFDYNNFVNEIIWFYKTGGASKDKFARKHDTIFLYQKSDKRVFNLQQEKSFMMHKYGFKKSDFKIDKETGLQYSMVYMKDVWELPAVGSATKERLGYPTQKPEILMERIIQASSNKGDLVLDPFCGCGTTMVIDQKSKRKWIEIDISPTAISLIEKRLEKLGAYKRKDFDVIGMPTTIAELKALEPFEFQNWVINELHTKQSKRLVSDMGIDGYVEKSPLFPGAAIQVKQSDNVGRNVIDNFETAIRRKNLKYGFIVAFSFSKGAHEEAARAKKEGLAIKLFKVEDFLSGKSILNGEI